MIELDKLINGYELAVERIRNERASLRLETPEVIRIGIRFDNNGTAMVGDNSYLYVNPCPWLELSSNKDAINAFSEIGYFFEKMRKGRHPYSDDKLIFEVLVGKKDISELCREYKNIEACKKTLKQNQEKITSLFATWKPFIDKPISEDIVNIIAQEVDHLDYLNKHPEYYEQMNFLSEELLKSKTIDKRVTLLQNHTETYINNTSEMEVRGHFFQQFREFGYDWTKLEKVKEETFRKVNDRYVKESFPKLYITYLSFKLGQDAGLFIGEQFDSLTLCFKELWSKGKVTEPMYKILNLLHIDNSILGLFDSEMQAKMQEWETNCRLASDVVYEEYCKLQSIK